MHTLTFRTPYKSITALPSIELPQLVILTGKNGSGKSHLLNGLLTGNIVSSLVAPHESPGIRLFDWNSIIPADTGVHDPVGDQGMLSSWFSTMKNMRDQRFDGIRSFAISSGIPARLCTNYKSLCTLSPAILTSAGFIGDPAIPLGQLEQQLKSLASDIHNTVQGQIPFPELKSTFSTQHHNNPYQVLYSSQSEIFQRNAFSWGQVDPFQNAFGKLFTTYRALLHQNSISRDYPNPDSEVDKFLHQTAFIEAYGEPPWEFVNRILATSDLDFRVEPPALHDRGIYEPKLHKVSTGSELKFQDLSSGEKVLMSFGLCLYNAQESRLQKIFPRLLLLDEIDAPLHPSMAASLLATISKVLVEEKGIYVIMTTHSPTTVAVAEEKNIYVMEADGPLLRPTSKDVALSILTTGLPTLSVSFDGRRQVFVESSSDARLYEALYLRYKAQIPSSRSLIFVEVGHKGTSAPEQNAGYEQVERIVTSLTNSGNRSVYGLVDWDGHRTTSDRLMVLSHGVRDGIESLLLDPVLVLLILVKNYRAFARHQGYIEEKDSYLSIKEWTVDRWQDAVDKIQEHTIGPLDIDKKIEIQYLNGMKLRIGREYIHLDDHMLVEKLKKNIPPINGIEKQNLGLLGHVVHEILDDHPQLLPLDLLETFKSLLA